ncbi:MAG: hypothetical protein HY800_00350 [Ignavibacteriales bacterium]|nr:hypothetical protein [Ignavibacteriales bacterium]
MNSGTCSVDSKSWLGISKIEFCTDIPIETDATSSSFYVPSLDLVLPLVVKQYLIKMEGSRGFHILLENGDKFSSYDNGTFLISENQLYLLRENNVSITIISESSVSMRDYYTQNL